MLEEPYHSLVLLVNIDSGQYIVRVLGTTREKGFYSTVEELDSIIHSRFSGTAVCVGNPALRGGRDPVEISQPFSMVVSARCLGYYSLAAGEIVLQGRGRCPHCSPQVRLEPSLSTQDITHPQQEEHSPPNTETTQTSEDMKILSNQLAPKKRGRPRIKRHQPPKTRQMSEVTKRKISENNKRFSICKICKKQCRGFRGLVDHMHRDHVDYKPWRCHMCDVRTAFVKTLYRHLKQEHGASGSPCPVCGKIFTRAQSMLHHVNKHDTEDKEDLKCCDCGETYHCPPHLLGREPYHCPQCASQDHLDYNRHIDNNFSLAPPEQDYNFLLYTETALSITDDGNVLRFPFINQDQKGFDDTQTVNEPFVDSSVFDKNFLVEDMATLNNSRINQSGSSSQIELSNTVNHHQRDGTVIRFCKNV